MPFNKHHLKSAAVILSLVALSGCATTRPAASSNTPSFGKAYHANLAAQSVAPTAKQKADTYIPANRSRRDITLEAYETDTIQPLPQSAGTGFE